MVTAIRVPSIRAAASCRLSWSIRPDHALCVLDLVDRVLELAVEDAPTGDDDHAIEDPAVRGVVQARETVRQPRDAVGLAAARRMLDQVVAARPLVPRRGDHRAHRVELVVAREDQRLVRAPPHAAPRVRDLPLPRLDEQEVAQDVEKAVARQHVVPEVPGAVPGRMRRIARPAVHRARPAPRLNGRKRVSAPASRVLMRTSAGPPRSGPAPVLPAALFERSLPCRVLLLASRAGAAGSTRRRTDLPCRGTSPGAAGRGCGPGRRTAQRIPAGRCEPARPVDARLAACCIRSAATRAPQAVGNLAGDRWRSDRRRGRKIPTVPQRVVVMVVARRNTIQAAYREAELRPDGLGGSRLASHNRRRATRGCCSPARRTKDTRA